MKKLVYRVFASVLLVASVCLMPSCSSHEEEPLVDLTPHLNKDDSLTLVSIYKEMGPWRQEWDMKDITTWNGVATALDQATNELRVVGLEIWNGFFRGHSISDKVCKLPELRRLVLVGNDLTGSIPDSIGNLRHLILFAVGSWGVTGTIPESIGNLSELVELSLICCSIEGELPATIGNLSKLEYLKIHQTKVGGSIPVELKNLRNLKQANMACNHFSGIFPIEILRDDLLWDFYDNDIEELPFEVWNDSLTCALPLLTKNHLSGEIPEWVKETKRWQKYALGSITQQKQGFGYSNYEMP